jgi:hypothetical protein
LGTPERPGQVVAGTGVDHVFFADSAATDVDACVELLEEIHATVAART